MSIHTGEKVFLLLFDILSCFRYLVSRMVVDLDRYDITYKSSLFLVITELNLNSAVIDKIPHFSQIYKRTVLHVFHWWHAGASV